jgi:dihydrofolate reductase
MENRKQKMENSLSAAVAPENPACALCRERKTLCEGDTTMAKLRVLSFSISIDGFGAGPNQDIDNPLGVGGMALHEWAFATRTFRELHGKEGGSTGVDNDFAVRGFSDIGAWILGRNMFGPIRGPWPDDKWKGWWGDTPPYHVPVFVLTNYTRESITMNGGTTFHFVTDGIHAALQRATDAANGKEVRVGGGVATIRQYLLAGLIDEMHLAISPALLGSGEHLLDGIDLRKLGYQCTEHVPTEKATHVVLAKLR